MHTAHQALRNTILLAACQISNPFLSLFLIGTLTRTLGAEGLGTYNLLLNIFFVAHAFTSLGLNTLITREVARDQRRAVSYLCSSAVLGIAVTLGGAGGLLLVLHFAGYGSEVTRGGWIVALALIPSIVILYSEAIFIAYEKIQFIVYLAVLENALKVIVGLWLLHAGFGIPSLMISFTAFRFLTLLLNLWIFNARIQPLAWHFERAQVRELVRYVPTFGTILIVATLYLRTDVFLLSKIATLSAVGYYAAAYRLFAISQVVPKSFNTSIFPMFSSLFASSQQSFSRARSLSIRYMLVALFPIAAGIQGLAEPIVRLLFGGEFAQSVPILKVVIWTLVPYGITNVLASSLFASNRQIIDLKVNVMGLVANVVLNLILIPRYQALGCAWATLLSICFFLACQLYFLRREILPVLREAKVFKPALAAVGLLMWAGLTSTLTLPTRILGGAVAYGVLIVVLQGASVRELKMVLPRRIGAFLPGEIDP